MITIASCLSLPEPDFDEAPLLRALAAAGVQAQVAAWDDPSVDWSRAGVVVIRSTWNYHQHLNAFLAWADAVSSVTTLLNDADVVRWNSHKGYLSELEKAGIAITPTELLYRGSEATLAGIMRSRQWSDVVIKPAVSGGSYRTLRSQGQAHGEEHLRDLLQDSDVLVQAYLPSVEARGERSMIFIDGQLTHAVRKSPRFQDDDEETIAVKPTAMESQFAEDVISACPFPSDKLMYARVDLAPLADGALAVMELELIEPSLFLTWGAHNTPESAAGLARLVARLQRERR